MQCIGIKKDGLQCASFVLNGQRCGVHIKTLNKVGPNQIRRNELKYTQQRRWLEISRRHVEAEDPVARAAEFAAESIRSRNETNALENIIYQDILRNNNVDADEIARNEVHRMRVERMRLRAIRIREYHERNRARLEQLRNNDRGQIALLNQGELAQLANDRQNIHTVLVVAKVKETIQKVLDISVPPEYSTETLKTTGEIILECKLSKEAAWQMMAKYCAEEDIYDLGIGIYPRVLNSVWQYIKSSPESEDLKKILAFEMQDNIGMCAQGNLSRLCNILSGYLDGIQAEVKSRNEILGELLSQLMNIEVEGERIWRAQGILSEQNVPDNEWDEWLIPLKE